MDALKPARVEETAGRATASYTAACPSDGEKAASNVNEYRGPGPSPSSGHAVTCEETARRGCGDCGSGQQHAAGSMQTRRAQQAASCVCSER